MFCDGAIFQANKPIRLFGTGGGRLEINFCGNSFEAEKVGAHWEAELPAMPYGGPYEMEITLDGRKQTLHDLYLGDVYVLAGQSNMQFKLRESDYDLALCKKDSRLRLFSTERVQGGERFFPQDGWILADETNTADWSCLGYLIGKELREKTGHAVGLITCYQGAADLQCFLPDSAFENPAFRIPEQERFDYDYPWNKGHSLLYDFQVKQITPYSAAAVIWYQGESNASPKESELYGEMLSCLIQSWRRDFKDEGLPFIVVQIADYKGRDNAFWHRIQQAQEEIQQKEPFVKTVISRDVCESTDIHPKRKYELAKRIAEAISK